jgi:hypothetical protein
LIEWGAVVSLSYLSDQADGSKTGADDFMAAGHTYGAYMETMRPYDAAELQTERLARDVRLQLALEDLENRFWRLDWSGRGPHTARDVALKLIEAAWQSGSVVDDGIRVSKSWGVLEIEAGVARQTLCNALARLEELGFAYRVKEPRKPGRAGAFVLRANVDHYEGGEEATEERTPNGLVARAPRLRWSSPGSKPKLGLISGTRRVRDSQRSKPRAAVKRPGKVRGAILDHLDRLGPSTVDELYDALHPNKDPAKRRPRELLRRKNPQTGRGRDGLLIMLEEAEILTIEDDTVSLTNNWLEALDDQRRVGREIDTVDVTGRVEAGDNTLALRNLDMRRQEYRDYLERRARRRAEKRPVSDDSRKAIEESREKRDAHLEAVEAHQEAKHATSPLAAAIRDYLERRPADARQPAGWIGSTLWAHDLHPGKPTPADVMDAIKELGGAAYLDGLLKRAVRRAA